MRGNRGELRVAFSAAKNRTPFSTLFFGRGWEDLKAALLSGGA
jgi:hypothetical protein